jgi:hypothetical protein
MILYLIFLYMKTNNQNNSPKKRKTLRERFELPWRSAPPVFKTGAVVRLATSATWFQVGSNIIVGEVLLLSRFF